MIKDIVMLAVISNLLFTSGGCELSTSIEPTLATGTVNADGKPLSGAVISLQPVGTTTGPNASTSVLNGKFEFGPVAELHGGTYRVEISILPSEILAKFPASQSADLPPAGSVIQRQFDADSILRCELLPGQTNRLEFNVKMIPRR